MLAGSQRRFATWGECSPASSQWRCATCGEHSPTSSQLRFATWSEYSLASSQWRFATGAFRTYRDASRPTRKVFFAVYRTFTISSQYFVTTASMSHLECFLFLGHRILMLWTTNSISGKRTSSDFLMVEVN